MSTHVRQQIREAVATLCTGLTTTGTRVFQSRIYPLNEDLQPTLIIYSQDESSTFETLGSVRLLERNLNLIIEGFCEGSSNIDDTLDTIAKEVETVLAGNRTLSGKCRDLFLSNTRINFDGTGNKSTGSISLQYDIIYYVNENEPQTAI